MEGIVAYLSVITLNVHGVNSLIKKNADWRIGVKINLAIFSYWKHTSLAKKSISLE
jgi:hypothetical protein